MLMLFFSSLTLFGLGIPGATSVSLSNPVLALAAGPARMAAPALALFGFQTFDQVAAKPVQVVPATPAAPKPMPVQPDLPAVPPPAQPPSLPTR